MPGWSPRRHHRSPPTAAVPPPEAPPPPHADQRVVVPDISSSTAIPLPQALPWWPPSPPCRHRQTFKKVNQYLHRNYMLHLMTKEQLFVSQVIHKAVIEVDEEGSKAVAITMAKGRVGCSGMKRPPPPPPVDFIADHPYLIVSTIYWNGVGELIKYSGICAGKIDPVTPWEAQLGQIMFSNLCEQLYGGPWRFARAAWHYRGNSGCYKVTIFFPFTLTDAVTQRWESCTE